MSAATVITQGYGSFGSPSLILTLGYGNFGAPGGDAEVGRRRRLALEKMRADRLARDERDMADLIKLLEKLES